MNDNPGLDRADRATTRRSLHGLAELVLAGPQFRQSGTIELRSVPGGFATVHDPAVMVIGHELVAGDLRVPLDGRSFDDLAAAIGLVTSPLSDVYTDGPGLLGPDVARVDPAVAKEIAHAFDLGDEALRQLAPDHRPILWPEHFDLAIEVEEVNFGVSPGDDFLDEPYAYVGPWQVERRVGEFWNAPFGAAQTLTQLGDALAVLAFFREGRSLVN